MIELVCFLVLPPGGMAHNDRSNPMERRMKPLNAAFAMRIEALRLARLAVKDRLKAQGVKISYVEQAEVQRLARERFSDHRAALVDQALINVLGWQLCKKRPLHS
jgi:hypothetical protein